MKLLSLTITPEGNLAGHKAEAVIDPDPGVFKASYVHVAQDMAGAFRILSEPYGISDTQRTEALAFGKRTMIQAMKMLQPGDRFDLVDYGENVAAIAALLHEDADTYQKIYDALPDDVGGFVGIWCLCAEAGQAFTEEASPYTAGEHYEWIEAIEDYTHKLAGYLQAGLKPAIADMRRLAIWAIETRRMRF